MIWPDILIKLISTRKLKTFSYLTWLPYPMQKLLSNMLFVLFINWIFQGVLGMQSKELIFRLAIYLIVFLASLFILPLSSFNPDVCLAIIVSIHTLNWILNGNFWVVVRYSKFYYQDPIVIVEYRDKIFNFIRSRPWLFEAVVLGSTAKNLSNPSPYSDIDLRIIFPPGINAWLKVNLLLLRLRISALFFRIPLDVYAYNNVDRLSDFNSLEHVFIVVDRDNKLRQFYLDRSIINL